MGLFESNKRIIFCLVGILMVLSHLSPVNAKSNEEIYQEKLDQLKPDDMDGYYKLGLWCKQNKLLEQAKIQFSKVLELDPKHKKARQDLESIIQSEKDAKIAEIIKKYGFYKGVLDKPGADSEKLPWEKAREKETEHLIVKTNLSVDALNDLCCLLECAYFHYQDLFSCEQPQGEKLRVMVTKNKDDYQKIYYDVTGTNSSPSNRGNFIPASFPGNKSGQNYLLSFYDPSLQLLLTFALLHECTHYAMFLLGQKYCCSQPPIWFNEGWATYCEASRLEGKRLVANCINQKRFPFIKDAINKRTYIKLKDFINCSAAEYNNVYYPEGWSLVYFLVNGQGGKYKTGLQSYMEAWKKNKIAMSGEGTGDYSPQDKPGHLKLFEECMSVPIDKLEKEWEEYILQLK